MKKETTYSILATMGFIISTLVVVGYLSNGFSIADSTQYEHSDDELHDYSVEIEGIEMKLLTVQQVAELWEIDAQVLLNKIIEEFNFKSEYAIGTTLDEMRLEYKFSPAMIKDMAEEIKQENIQNE